MLSNLKLSFYESIILQILPRTSQLYSYPCAHPFILAASAIVSVCWATFHDISGYIVLKMEIRKKLKAGEFAVPNCQYVIIDTDAGGDDSQAILLAISEAKRTGKTIVGITCIDGNAALDDVAVNVLINVCLADADIPVFKGTPSLTQAPAFLSWVPRTRTTTSARTASA